MSKPSSGVNSGDLQNRKADRASERLSIFDIIKIGVGPSSSHTMGPWIAARRFLGEMSSRNLAGISRVTVHLYGSLAKTGKGHATDVAVQLGLAGVDPEAIDPDDIPARIQEIAFQGYIKLLGQQVVPFEPSRDVIFHKGESLPIHPNGMRFVAALPKEEIIQAEFYSVGGGFVISEKDEIGQQNGVELPYEIDSAGDLLASCLAIDGKISEVVRRNEQTWRTDEEIDDRLQQIYDTMLHCVFRGCHTEGVLPGGLGVKRRAAAYARTLHSQTQAEHTFGWFQEIEKTAQQSSGFSEVIDWVTCFALAVNEENAALGRVVTAPTNGSAGVIPAVLLYFRIFCGADKQAIYNFLLSAGEIGCLFKKGATISAAMGGCQAEIGVSSAMAAAALAEGLGATPSQAAIAAEIAMEHHLGMTCDPIGGLVQVPCIERNAFGAMKAITAARMALKRDPVDACVSLDGVIQTMWETAQGMHENYKETSDGGLAVLIPVSMSEC
ncbi:L-serine ammonia-lyase [Adhaeretor mobilis]|uniref:L-serine ammonia-lyase n=1 Tax=Adhaeretor mobilis TaxID=1930276 RepID=A0A517MUD1_9BACT|nr:L-serine ammonia-lyase [Adhaeretor mobilis]QDS98397.1 L-serine dehydratase 2 [Adhaeretor mobilis]